MEFPARLRAAVSASELSLEQIAALLDRRGTPVSRSSLSAWQSGISRPERAGSLRALAALEEVLGLQPGELRSALAPRERRGRLPAQGRPLVGSDSWRNPEAVARLLARVGAVPLDPSEPQRLSQRMVQYVDADRGARRADVEMLVQARTQQATRILRINRRTGFRVPPTVTGTRGLVTNAFRADAASGICVHELLLDPALRPGELAVVGFTERSQVPDTSDYTNLRVQPGTREVVIEVRFDPAALPREVVGFRQHRTGSREVPQGVRRDHEVGPSYQLVVLDPKPGIYGVRWFWS